VGNGARAATIEVFEGATMVETVLEEVDDLLVGDVDYGYSWSTVTYLSVTSLKRSIALSVQGLRWRACRRSTACTCEGSRPIPASPLPGPCEYPSDP
jgi:hypothetical protein